MPTLNNDILKDIFKQCVGNCGSYDKVRKFYLSGKECLDAFCDIMKEIKSVSINDYVKYSFDNFGWSCNDFPKGLWKRMAQFVPELSIDAYPAHIYMPFIVAFQNSKNLQKLDMTQHIKNEALPYLMSPSIREVITTPPVLFAIKSMGDDIWSNIETITVVVDPDRMKNFFRLYYWDGLAERVTTQLVNQMMETEIDYNIHFHWHRFDWVYKNRDYIGYHEFEKFGFQSTKEKDKIVCDFDDEAWVFEKKISEAISLKISFCYKDNEESDRSDEDPNEYALQHGYDDDYDDDGDYY